MASEPRACRHDAVSRRPWAYGGGNGGGWTFINCKDTVPVGVTASPQSTSSATARPTRDGNNGANTFINCDWAESEYETRVRIGSMGNTFIRVVSSPATVFYIEGQQQHVPQYADSWRRMGCRLDHNSFDVRRSPTVSSPGLAPTTVSEKRPSVRAPALALQMTGVGNSFDDGC